MMTTYLRLIFFGILTVLLHHKTIGQARLNGLVTQQNSGRKPIAEVEVKSLFANPVRSGSDGRFMLVFQNQQPGATVNVTVQKAGWEVVNAKELLTALLQAPDARPLSVILCEAGQLAKARMAYYDIGERYIRDEYARRMKSLDREKAGWQQKAAQFEQELNILEKQLKEVADDYSRLNLDDMTATERKALTLFKAGQIDESIKLRESMNSEQAIKKALSTKATLDSVITANTRNLLTTAKEYQLTFDFAKAEATLEKLALTDTTNYQNAIDFASYLYTQRQYNKGLVWCLTAGRHTKTDGQVALVLNNLGILYQAQNAFVKAEGSYNKALIIRERLVKTDPQTFEPDLAATVKNLGNLYRAKNDYAQAEGAYSRALSIYERLAKSNPQAFETSLAGTLNNLGLLFQERNDYKQAEDAYNKALGVYERLAKTNPQAVDFDLGGILNNLGILYQKENDYIQAEGAYSRALSIHERLAKSNPQAFETSLATTLNNLGLLFQDKNEYERARETLTRALVIRERLAKTDPQTFEPRLAMTLTNLGSLLHSTNDYAQAEGAYSRALSIYERLAKSNPQAFDIEWCRTAMLIGLLQKADLHPDRLGATTALLANARKKLASHSDNLEAVDLIKRVDDLEAYFATVRYAIEIEAIKKQVAETQDYGGKTKLQQQVIDHYQVLLDKGYRGFSKDKGSSLGGLAWYQLFTRQFVQAEASTREALFPTKLTKPEGYDEAVEWVNTNLALALLYQGKLDEAKAIYLRLKDKPYNKATYRETFLADLDELDKAGITHPDVAVIRALLRPKP